VSILFRTKRWLTIAQLIPAWAAELPDAHRDPDHIARDLAHCLLEDMINGRLDGAGPVADGRRLGLRLITPEGTAGFIEGHHVRELNAVANTPEWRSFLWNRVVVLKEAVLDFAARYQLPSPSWWANASGATDERQAIGPNQSSRVSKPEVAARRRGRKPKKLEQVKEAMKTDLRRGRYTMAQLQESTEKKLAATYGVSRDTARKALSAVVSEIAEKSIRDNIDKRQIATRK
jgi:hypothetical protein